MTSFAAAGLQSVSRLLTHTQTHVPSADAHFMRDCSYRAGAGPVSVAMPLYVDQGGGTPWESGNPKFADTETLEYLAVIVTPGDAAFPPLNYGRISTLFQVSSHPNKSRLTFSMLFYTLPLSKLFNFNIYIFFNGKILIITD